MAKLISEHGFYSLPAAFKCSSLDVSYLSAQAKRKLLQMPLAAITFGKPASGKLEVFLMEAVNGLDYHIVKHFLESKRYYMTGLSKEEV